MSLNFLLEEREKYDDCRGPLKFGNGKRYFLQPPEITDNCLDEIVTELLSVASTMEPGCRVDGEGEFYSMVMLRGSPKKKIISGMPSIEKIFEQMRGLGYNVPENYWAKNRARLMPELNRKAS